MQVFLKQYDDNTSSDDNEYPAWHKAVGLEISGLEADLISGHRLMRESMPLKFSATQTPRTRKGGIQ